jgi:acetoin utilization deacetylase AcuC-like enzyme
MTMRLYSSDCFVLPLPPGHRFPMPKYARLRARVEQFAAERLVLPAAATDDDLVRAHDRRYIDAVMHGTLDDAAQRRIGFPWSAAMVERSRRSAGATIAACERALVDGCGVNLAGGTHHAHAGFGSGFCVFNDAAVATRAMQARHRIGRVLIIDLDVHQGDGTAAILRDDDSVFTLSMHGRNNFPFRKATSRLDIELDDGTGDATYLATLAIALPRAIAASRPDLAIYLAGADPFIGDRLGRLALTKRGLAARDALVLDTLRAAEIAVAIAMAGGYADDIDDTVDIHVATIRLALERFDGAAMLESSGSRYAAEVR